MRLKYRGASVSGSAPPASGLSYTPAEGLGCAPLATGLVARIVGATKTPEYWMQVVGLDAAGGARCDNRDAWLAPRRAAAVAVVGAERHPIGRELALAASARGLSC